MLKTKILLSLVIFGQSLSLFAEYRVYQYYISSRQNKIQDSKPYLVTSSLDPVSYVAYNGGQTAIRADLLRTWICPGNTAQKEYCASPYERLPATTQ